MRIPVLTSAEWSVSDKQGQESPGNSHTLEMKVLEVVLGCRQLNANPTSPKLKVVHDQG